MIKVMIVDDEKIVIDSISFILKKNFSNIDTIITARSGREAIEKVESIVPDIVFMDIKMPGINGIEAIKQIKSQHNQIIFIIITAFNQFEYAKDSINLGVFEYLLKPVNHIKVIEVIEKAMNKIKSERKKRNLELDIKEKLQKVIPVLENGFIYSIIFFDDNKNELLNYKELFGIKEDAGYIMTIEFGDYEKDGKLQNKIGNSVRSQKLYPNLQNIITSLKKCIIGPIMLNRIVIFIPAKNNESKLIKVSFAKKVYKMLSDKLQLDYKIGIGTTYNDFELLSISYEESLEALRSLRSTGIMYYHDISKISQQNNEYPYQKEKLFLQKLSQGNEKESIVLFYDLFDTILNIYNNDSLKIKNKLLEIVFLVNRLILNHAKITEYTEEVFFQKILYIEDMDDLKIYCKRIIEKVAKQICSLKEDNVGNITKKAKEYIKLNYKKQINLEDVSQSINVSSQYLSRLFKAETGENFIDYLTSIRIEKAKDLLQKTDMSIKEICFQIGYSDPNYFSRLFKKMLGLTPTEYKDKLKS